MEVHISAPHEEDIGNKILHASKGLLSMLSSEISEIYDKSFDDFEMVEVVGKSIKIEEILNVIIPSCEDKQGNKIMKLKF